MKQFIAHGIVQDGATGQPVPGLRIEAWDKDLIFDDLVGSAYSDVKGYFRMVFDRSYFKELFLDRYPDIYFRVFQGNKLIKDTKDSVLWNSGKDEGGAYLEIEIDATLLEAFGTDTQFGEKSSTRSIFKATYTPRKATRQELEQAANTGRGVEKGSFIASLKVAEEEVVALKEKLTLSQKKQEESATYKGKKLLNAIEIIAEAIGEDGQVEVMRRARSFATIDLQSLEIFATNLIALREEVLGEVIHVQDKLLKKYREARTAPVMDTTGVARYKGNVQTLWQWGSNNQIDTELAAKGNQLAKALNLNPRKVNADQFAALAKRQLQQLKEYAGGLRGILEKEPVGYLHLEKMSFTPAGIERGELVYSLPLAPGEEVNIAHKEWSHTEEEFERIVTDYMEEFSEEGVAEKSEFSQAVNSQSQHSSAFNVGVTASGSYAGFSISSSFGYNASESSSKSQQSTRNQAYEITQKAASRTKKEHKISFKVASAAETEDQTVRKIKNPYEDKPIRIDYYQLIRKWQVNLFREGIRLTWDMAIPEPGSGLLLKLMEIRELKKNLTLEFNLEDVLGIAAKDISLLPDDENFYLKVASRNNISLVDMPPEYEINKWISFHQVYQKKCQGSDLWDTREIFQSDVLEIPEEYVVNGAIILEDFERYLRNNADATPADNSCNSYVFHLIALEIFKEKDGDPNIYGYMGGDHNYFHKDEMAGWVRIESATYPSAVFWERKNEAFQGWDGKSGKLVLEIRIENMQKASFSVRIPLKLNENNEHLWKQKVWNQMYEFKKAEYYENRQKLKDRLAQLEEELGEQDALSLRKKEREEVMKGVLRWIGIENFNFFPEDLFPNAGGSGDDEVNMEDLYGSDSGLLSITEQERMAILTQGEIIKFLHQAIEWEQMLYFLYPYFWTHPTRWEFKKYLNHPDPLHQAFLKAGSARVILTIRPGFEAAFLAFINKGPDSISDLPSHPYLSIGEEFRNYAKTNYPGIPAANPIANYRPLLYPKQQKTWEDMQQIMKLLEEYRKRPFAKQRQAWRDMQVIMEYLEDIRATAGSYPASIPPQADPWGNHYNYETVVQVDPADNSSRIVDFKLWSWGADNKAGGDEEDADITSWAEPEGGNYPFSLNQLKASFAGEEEVPLQDSWGGPYYYRFPGEHGDYDLVSYGANGMPGGEAEDADITSWAEAALIGQWFEYTPTSAMDISLDNYSN